MPKIITTIHAVNDEGEKVEIMRSIERVSLEGYGNSIKREVDFRMKGHFVREIQSAMLSVVAAIAKVASECKDSDSGHATH